MLFHHRTTFKHGQETQRPSETHKTKITTIPTLSIKEWPSEEKKASRQINIADIDYRPITMTTMVKKNDATCALAMYFDTMN